MTLQGNISCTYVLYLCIFLHNATNLTSLSQNVDVDSAAQFAEATPVLNCHVKLYRSGVNQIALRHSVNMSGDHV